MAGPPSDRAVPAAGSGSIAQRLRYALLVVLPLAAVLALLWFSYTRYQAARDRYLTASYLRALGAVAEQTEGSINGLSGAVDQAFEEWERTVAANPVTVRPTGSRRSCAAYDALAGLLKLSRLRISRDASRGATTTSVNAAPRVTPQRQSRPRDDRGTSMLRSEPVDSAGADLLFCRAVPWPVRRSSGFIGCDGTADSPYLCAERSLGEIVRTRLVGSDLDGLDVLLVDEQGTVLFESGHSGLRYLVLQPPHGASTTTAGATAPPAAPLPSVAEISSATIARTVRIDGTAYRFFSHPLRLETGEPQKRNWAIAAVVRADQMEAESRVPLMVLAGIPVVVILAALMLPFLKLATLGRREPLPPSTVAGVALALLVGSAYVTSALLATLAAGQLRDRYDTELNVFAWALERNFTTELERAYDTLVAYRDQRMQVDPQLLAGASYVSCIRGVGGAPWCERHATRDAPGAPAADVAAGAPALTAYPLWNFLVLVGDDGWQREKWTRQAVNTAVLDLSTYSAFTDVRDGRMLPLGGDARRPYALNVMTSPNTGSTVTLLSAPIRDTTRSRSAPQGALVGAALMAADFASVSDPIVAPDIGFAVISRSGQVIFHSNDRLRLYENFFTEVGDAGPLRAAMFANRGGFFDLEYHGQPRRLLLRPFADSDWSLVVYRDRDALRMLIVQVSLVATLFGAGLAVGWLLWLGGARWVLGPGLMPALWPDPRAVARYRLLRLPLFALVCWGVLLLWKADPFGQLLGVCLAGLVALTATLLTLTLGQVASTRWLTGAAVLLMLVLLTTGLSLVALPIWGTAAWLAIALLVFSTVGGWEPSWIPSDDADRAATVRLHCWVTGLLLIILAVLPPAVIVRDAVAAGGSGLTRARQIELAERVHARRRTSAASLREVAGDEEFAARHRVWGEPGLTAFRHSAVPPPLSGNGAGRYLQQWAEAGGLCDDGHGPSSACRFAAHPVGRRDDAARLRCELLRRHPTAPIVAGLSLPVFLHESLQRRYTSYPQATDCAWFETDSGRYTVFGFGNDDGADARVDLPNWDLRLLAPRPLALALLIAGVLALAWLGWWLLGWALRRVFCVEAWGDGVSVTTLAAASGRFHLRPTPARLARLQQWAATGEVLDLAEYVGADDLTARRATIEKRPILIQHWEHVAVDGARRRATLELLEDLALRRRLPVELVSEIDILTAVAADGDDEPHEIVRWARLLERVDKQRDDLPPAPLPPRTGEIALLYDECRWTPRLLGIRDAILADPRWTALSPTEVLRHVGDLAEAHYRCLWATLTQEERLLLCHLAADGFVNPRVAGLAQDLLRRGLIRRTPVLRVMNESFRRFVLGVEDRATIRAWERAAGTSPWTWVRNGVLAVVVVGGVLLFVTQPESYTRWAGLLGALTTVGGGMVNLLGLFQAKRPAAG